MYVYDMPFEINRELCRILDNDDDWKELAGHMSYTAFDINIYALSDIVPITVPNFNEVGEGVLEELLRLLDVELNVK